MRKFYKIAEVMEDAGGFIIHLDGKPLMTPQKTRLMLHGKALAEAIAEEWRAQDAFILPATMPITQLASTAIDRIAPNFTAAIDATLEYVKTDLLCYRADDPAELVTAQAALFDPLLEWFEESTGQTLVVARGLMPVTQPEKTLQSVKKVLAEKTAEQLTAIQVGAALASSLVIALALCEGTISADDAYQAAFSEELFQIQKWGEDDEARARLILVQAEFQTLERFSGLLAS